MRKPIVLGIALIAAAGVAAAAPGPGGRNHQKPAAQQLTGHVDSVNARTRMLIVEEPDKNNGPRKIPFTMDDRGRIEFQDKVGRLDELKVGDIVTVGYHMSEGKYLADEVSVARKARPPVPPKPAP